MVRTISTSEAQANLGDLLGSVYDTKEPVIVEDAGEPVAVVISPDDFARFRRQAVEQAWATIQAVQERNADKDPDEVLRDVTAEVEAVRRERHERSRTGTGGR